MRMVALSRLAICAVALSLVLTGCTRGSGDPQSERSPRPTTSKAPTLESVAQDLLPGLSDAPKASSNLPARIDIPKQRPSSLLKGPAVGAKLGMVRWDLGVDANGLPIGKDDGFADEDVYFLGTDDEWRVLNRGDLGLLASDWPGSDGAGMGRLSPSGTQWSFATTRHIVVLDLMTKKMKFLRLPGGQRPILHGWTERNTLLLGLEWLTDEGPSMRYELDPKSGSSSMIKVSALRSVTVLANGDRAIGGSKNGRPFVDYVTSANERISRREFGFAWDQPLGLYVDHDVTVVFLDSLGLPDSTSEGSMVVVVDPSLRLKASLPWPNRTKGDDVIGWVSDETFLLAYGETLAAWCPGESKISRVSTVSSDLSISMATDVIDATCT